MPYYPEIAKFVLTNSPAVYYKYTGNLQLVDSHKRYIFVEVQV